jgi:CRISPR-associated protein Cas2
VADQGRLHRVRKRVQAYSVGGQKSFYECRLTQAELRSLTNALADAIKTSEDRVHIFQLDPRVAPIFYGRAKRRSIQPFLIV